MEPIADIAGIKRAVKTLAEERDKLSVAESETQHAIAQLQEKLDRATKRRREKIAELETQIEAACHSHRHELTGGGERKTVEVAHGTIKWTNKPPSVLLLRDEQEIVLDLHISGMLDLIRIKESINKQAILRDPARVLDVPGLEVVVGEESFSIVTDQKPLKYAA